MSACHIVLDLEMNPVSMRFADVCHGLKTETIEIGAVKIDTETNQVVDEYTCVVRPEFNHRIEPNITRLTGIRTAEVRSAQNFAAALDDFTRWVGPEPVSIYCWSPSDHLQLRSECRAKHIPFPAVLDHWIDFQAEYPKYLGGPKNRCLSLKNAAQAFGTVVLPGSAHRALYDAQITAKLVLFVLSGAYKCYSGTVAEGRNTMTYSIGDACGGKLAALLARLGPSAESEVYPTPSLRSAEALTR